MKRKKNSYSPKNVPFPSKKSYELQLSDKSECVIKQTRRKADANMMLIAPVIK